MGIAGLYEILSPAEKKYSLDDLALGHIDRYNCNLRVAIDVSIWNFQAQSSQGGKNAALRTIFYRCCKLYNLGIKAVFVFDGDQRPSYKRKRNINTNLVNTTEHHLLIVMLKLFKFMVWQASGEAEAECAVLQRLGYVDLVITTDIDVFLFGAQRVLRNFPMSSNEPAVCMDSEWIKDTTMLDRSDLILMGLISGSDYFSGVNQVGIQLACSLARSKHHIKFMDALLDQTKNNTRDFLNDSNENDEEGEKINNDMLILLEDMLNGLQSELLRNHSGFLQRRYTHINFDGINNAEQLITLTKGWIQPKTAIMDKNNLLNAKVLTQWVYQQQQCIPDFMALACFCQTNFEWPKEVIISKFGRILFQGYMLQHTLQQAKTPICDLLITNNNLDSLHSAQQRKKIHQHHPYFNPYCNSNSNGSIKNITSSQPIDLFCIHSIENKRPNKPNHRYKNARFRVEWNADMMQNFLNRASSELMDDINNSQPTNSQSSMENNKTYDRLQNNNAASINSYEDDDEIDLSISMETSSILPYNKNKWSALDTSPSSSSLKRNANHVSFKENEVMFKTTSAMPPIDTQLDGLDNKFDIKKGCKQWINYRLLQRAYPKIVDDYMKKHELKKLKKNNQKSKRKNSLSVLENQSTLDRFVSPIRNNKGTDKLVSKIIKGTDQDNHNKNNMNENKITNINHTTTIPKAFILLSDDDDDNDISIINNINMRNLSNINNNNDDNNMQNDLININHSSQKSTNHSSQKSIEDYLFIPPKRIK